jgi:hypothetical protein
MLLCLHNGDSACMLYPSIPDTRMFTKLNRRQPSHHTNLDHALSCPCYYQGKLAKKEGGFKPRSYKPLNKIRGWHITD